MAEVREEEKDGENEIWNMSGDRGKKEKSNEKESVDREGEEGWQIGG